MSDPIRCTDACGAAVRDVSEAEAKAWTRLQITGRYRCPECVRALNEINFATLAAPAAASTKESA